MHRLFVAIRPPREVRALLLGLMDGVMAARWQDDDQLHLTLRFIGPVDGHGAHDVVTALTGVRCPAFTVQIAGLGVFERKGRIENLWAGVADPGDLTALHHKIDRALVMAGFAPEGRMYKPHVTLARFGRRGGDVSGIIARHGGLSLPAFRVDAFQLYESRTRSQGADYTVLERYPLALADLPSARALLAGRKQIP